MTRSAPPAVASTTFSAEGHAEGDVAGHDVVGGADAGTAGADLDIEVALLEEAEQVGGVERGVVGRGEPVGLYRHRGHLRQHRHGAGHGGLLDGHLGFLGGRLGLGGSRLGGRSGLLRSRKLCFELGHLLVGDGRVGGGRLQSRRGLSRSRRRGVGLGPGGVGLGPGGVGLGLGSLDRGCVHLRGCGVRAGLGDVVSIVAAGRLATSASTASSAKAARMGFRKKRVDMGCSSVRTDSGEGGRRSNSLRGESTMRTRASAERIWVRSRRRGPTRASASAHDSPSMRRAGRR